MGVIMILLNVNFSGATFSYSNISFMFTGKYEDFTADWYSNIGSVIILTMVFNIAFPIIELCLTGAIKLAKKCWDTRCYCKATSCDTKDQYVALYSDDIFPIGERYAYLISTFVVSVAFCGVIPMLVPVTFVSFFLLFFVDKFLLFKMYQITPNYTPALHRMLVKVCLGALLIHLGLTAFLLSEPSMVAGNKNSLSSLFTTGSQRLNNMFTVPYVVPYSICFILLLMFILLKAFVFDFFRNCYNYCFQRLIEPN
jgi:hypothetical protein